MRTSVTLAACLLAASPAAAGPWHGHRTCPPGSYCRSNYWIPGVKRHHILHHHHPDYQYPSDRYLHIPATFILQPYPCPPVDPDVFYGNLHRGRRQHAGAGRPFEVFTPANTPPEDLPPPRRPEEPGG